MKVDDTVCQLLPVKDIKNRLKRLTLTNGGTNNIDNIIPACERCNGSKGNRDILWFKYHVMQLPLEVKCSDTFPLSISQPKK